MTSVSPQPPRFVAFGVRFTPDAPRIIVDLTTDIQTHLYLVYTYNKPSTRLRTIAREPYRRAHHNDFVLRRYKIVEQNEPGDTFFHSFTITAEPGCHNIYLSWFNQLDPGPARSLGPILALTYCLDPGTPNYILAATNGPIVVPDTKRFFYLFRLQRTGSPPTYTTSDAVVTVLAETLQLLASGDRYQTIISFLPTGPNPSISHPGSTRVTWRAETAYDIAAIETTGYGAQDNQVYIVPFVPPSVSASAVADLPPISDDLTIAMSYSLAQSGNWDLDPCPPGQADPNYVMTEDRSGASCASIGGPTFFWRPFSGPQVRPGAAIGLAAPTLPSGPPGTPNLFSAAAWAASAHLNPLGPVAPAFTVFADITSRWRSVPDLEVP